MLYFLLFVLAACFSVLYFWQDICTWMGCTVCSQPKTPITDHIMTAPSEVSAPARTVAAWLDTVDRLNNLKTTRKVIDMEINIATAEEEKAQHAALKLLGMVA